MPTKTGKIEIAMIGCGEISAGYVDATLHVEDGEVIWCADISESQARRLGERFDIPWTTDIDKVITDPKVDVVIISVPHAIHEELTIKAAAAGKHIMCDKPICASREGALRMIEACRKAGVKLGINYASRYMGAAVVAKDIFARKVIGDIIMVKISAYANKPDLYWTTGILEGGNTSWRGSKKMAGGGIGIMNMSHEIDRMSYCTGLKIVHMKGESDTFMAKVEVEDTLAGIWRYDNGAIGVVIAGSNMCGGSHEPTRVFGTHGQMELWEPLRIFTIREDTEFKSSEWHAIEAPEVPRQYAPYIADFLKAIREDTDPPITAEDGFRVMDAVFGIYESSETGKTVYMQKEV